MTQPTGDAPEIDDRENNATDSDATESDATGGAADSTAADGDTSAAEAAGGGAGDSGATEAEAGGEGAGDDGAGEADAKTAPSRARRGEPDLGALEREGEIAADYLEELLDIADLDGDIDMDVERDRAAVSVVGGDLDHLVGDEGVVLEALQELTRLAVLTQTGERSRLMLDVAGYRAGRRAVLSELGRTTAEQVKSSGEPARLNPMTPFERKIVHDAVAAAGLRSESEGEEPQRRVVVLPA
jgi:spoIIIJ-associated protein